MPTSKKCDTSILNSFLSDIECKKVKQCGRIYYSCTPDSSQHISAKYENIKPVLNATWQLLTLRGNVQHFCNELHMFFSDELMKYLNSPSDSLAFINALPLNWKPLKQTWTMIEDEITKLIENCSELECNETTESDLSCQDDASNVEMLDELPDLPVEKMMAYIDEIGGSPAGSVVKTNMKSWSLVNIDLINDDKGGSSGSMANGQGSTSEIIPETGMKESSTPGVTIDVELIKSSASDCANSDDTVPLVLKKDENETNKDKLNMTMDSSCEDILNMVPCDVESSNDSFSLQLSLSTSIVSEIKTKVKKKEREESPSTLNTIATPDAMKTVECMVQISADDKRMCDRFIALCGLAAEEDDVKMESDDNSSLQLAVKRGRKKQLSEIESNCSNEPSKSSTPRKRRRISSESETSSQSSHDSGSNFSTESRLTISSASSYASIASGDTDVDELMGHVFSEDEDDDISGRSSTTEVTSPSLRSRTKAKAGASENNNCRKVSDPDAAWRRDPLLNEPLEEKENDTQNSENSRRRRINSVADSETSSNLADEQPKLHERTRRIATESPPAGKSPKKGRKNLREIIAEEDLDVLTQAANTAERERIERLKQRQSSMQQWSQTATDISGASLDEDLVLDDSEEERIVVHRNLTRKLKEHQKIGVRFMWDNCYESAARAREHPGAGCILAHCMGLGKTLQVITLIHTLFKHRVADTRRVLVICPTSTVLNWRKEFKMAFKVVRDAALSMPVITIKRNATIMDRAQTIGVWKSNGGVLLLGYEAFASVVKAELTSTNEALLDPGPDLVVCDEGHLLKNGKTIRTQVISRIKTKRRIILTGTPMQNNLEEYYHMVAFVKPAILGTYKEYRNRFMNPITNGQYENSSHQDIQLMKKRSHVLHKMTKGFIQRFEESELKQYLPEKYDYVLKIELHPLQVKLYKKYFSICNARQKRLFADQCVFQMIHSHPKLLAMQAKEYEEQAEKNKGKKQTDPQEAILAETLVENRWWKEDVPDGMDASIEYGPKFDVMMTIVEECLKKHEKVLIFSHSITELTLIESFLQSSKRRLRRDRDYYRMDGRVPTIKRHQYCSTFNEPDSRVKVFLLTNRVGGLGLNLTGANRAILMDVSWNPTLDTQSIFRIYRLGQKKPCYVYRLVAKGTMEEVIYERSVTKQAIAGRVVDEMQITRHFNASELEAMYRCDLNCQGMNKPTPKLPSDAILAELLTRHACVFTYHNHNDLLQNRPDEVLNEEEMKLAWEEYENEKNLPPLQQPQSRPIPPGLMPPQINPYMLALNAMMTTARAANPTVTSAALATNTTALAPTDYAKENSSKCVLFTTLRGHNVRVKASSSGLVFSEAAPEEFTMQQIITANEIFHRPLANPSQSLPQVFIVDRDGTLKSNRNSGDRSAVHLRRIAPAGSDAVVETVDLEDDDVQILDSNASFLKIHTIANEIPIDLG